MISNEMQTLLNEQFHKELFSSNLYLAMSSWFMQRDLDGFANYFRIQAQEEVIHAMKQYDYLHTVDGKVTMMALEAPRNEYESALEVFEAAYAHEQLVTRGINEITGHALKNNDFASYNFMQWFVNEQVEEEANMRTLIQKVKMVGDNSSALYLLNEELGRRSLAPEESA